MECADCKEEFKKGDTLYECTACNEVFCEECIETHDCIHEMDLNTENNVCCSKCGEYGDEYTFCPICDEPFCDRCLSDHLEFEQEHSVAEHDFCEYAKRKIVGKL